MSHVLGRRLALQLARSISSLVSLSNLSVALPLASGASATPSQLLKKLSDTPEEQEAMSVCDEDSRPPPAKKACLGEDDENKTGGDILECEDDKIKKESVTEIPQEMGVATKRSRKRRKFAVLLSYNGKGYMGMQRNPDVATIEEDLLAAMCKAEAFPADMINDMSKLKFQRCARTDKGVSASRQVVSLKINMKDAVALINAHLPVQIRVMVAKRVTKSFDCRHACSARMYEYLLPTYALAPYHLTLSDYRVSDEIVSRLDQLLSRYEGTHNYHNFTSGKKFQEMSSKRYIMSFKCGSKFISGDASDPSVKPMEFIPLRVKGQSFVLHQIRKMIGFVVAIIRGYIEESNFEISFKEEKMDIPKAPSLGLLLENVYFDHYNARFANSGERERLEWEEFEEEVSRFKSQHIYRSILQTELREMPMMQWLHTLQLHNFYSTMHRLRGAEASSTSKSDSTPTSTADVEPAANICSTTHTRPDPADSLVDPSDTGDSPANIIDSQVEPSDTADSLVDPANTADSQVEPSDTADSLVDTANTADSQIEPSDTADSLVDPDNTADSQVEPSDTADSLVDTANTADSQVEPSDTADSLVDTANTVDPSDTVDSATSHSPADPATLDGSLADIGEAKKLASIENAIHPS